MQRVFLADTATHQRHPQLQLLWNRLFNNEEGNQVVGSPRLNILRTDMLLRMFVILLKNTYRCWFNVGLRRWTNIKWTFRVCWKTCLLFTIALSRHPSQAEIDNSWVTFATWARILVQVTTKYIENDYINISFIVCVWGAGGTMLNLFGKWLWSLNTCMTLCSTIDKRRSNSQGLRETATIMPWHLQQR